MNSLFDLKNKNIILIGAAGLLGQNFALEIVNSGANIGLVDFDKVALDQFKEKLASSLSPDQKVISYQADITSPKSIDSLITQIKTDFGTIHAMINNAYPRNRNYGRSFFEVEYKDFCENLGMHLGGYFLTTQKFGQLFKQQKGGKIVNISSIYGVIAPKFEVYEGTEMTMPVEYSAIKAGLIHLTKYTAKLLGPFGVHANCLSPGGIENGQDPSFLESYNKRCLSKGMLAPKDMNGAMLFLLSDASNFMNGQNLIIDDGFTL